MRFIGSLELAVVRSGIQLSNEEYETAKKVLTFRLCRHHLPVISSVIFQILLLAQIVIPSIAVIHVSQQQQVYTTQNYAYIAQKQITR